MGKANRQTEQMNAKLTVQEATRVQEVNQEFFGGELNKSDTLRFLIKVALVAIENAKVEVQTKRTIKIGRKVMDLS